MNLTANELRIGNWVMDNKGRIGSVHLMTMLNGVYVLHLLPYLSSNHFHKKLSQLQPIPLSEEILLKAGFVFRKELDSAYIKRIFLWEREYIINIQYASIDGKDRFFTSMSTLTDDYTYNGGEIEDITYNDIIHDIVIQETVSVHQLQNLIHALTGEELTINL